MGASMSKGGGMVVSSPGSGLGLADQLQQRSQADLWRLQNSLRHGYGPVTMEDHAQAQLEALRHYKRTMPAVVPAPEREDCPGCGAPTAADGGCDYCGRA